MSDGETIEMGVVNYSDQDARAEMAQRARELLKAENGELTGDPFVDEVSLLAALSAAGITMFTDRYVVESVEVDGEVTVYAQLSGRFIFKGRGIEVFSTHVDMPVNRVTSAVTASIRVLAMQQIIPIGSPSATLAEVNARAQGSGPDEGERFRHRRTKRRRASHPWG